ncbi:TPA: DUF1266 domain-containing protein [Escherichia coli]
MKKVLLQNHPGSEKYSFNGWEIFNSNFERMIKENKAMLLCKWGGYLTCVVAVMFVFAAITSNGLNERGLITAGCSFLYLLIMMGLIVRAGFKAKKEQLHYYQAKGIEPLSIEKLQALQLIAPYRFYHKQWSETLEFWPRKPEPGKDTFQYHVLPFDSIDIISKRRESLEDQWGIEDSESYCALMEHFLSGDHGANTFKANMEEAPEQVIALLNKFAVFPSDYISDCANNRSSKSSAKLIWAAELSWMISISSTAFQNGTIEEELAWHYIMLASRKAHELFESEEDYQKNSLMGFLYWHICCYRRKLTDAELEACYRYDKQFWEHYSKKCRWPIRNVPWGASSVKYS